MQANNALTIAYLEKHPADAARVLENFPYSMSAQMLDQLSPDKYLAAFQFLIPSYAANLLDTLTEENKDKLVNALSSENLSMLLVFFDKNKQNSLLCHLPNDKRASVVRQMQYPMDTVGAIMGPPSFSLPNDITASEALKRIKNSKKKYPSIIFILDRSFHYIGAVTLDKLIKTQSNTRLGAITDSSLQALTTRKSLRNLTTDPAWTTTLMLPVTDSRGIFAGVLEYRTLQHHEKAKSHLDKPQEKINLSTLELIFQALAILLEGLTMKMFPVIKTIKPRDKHHDNVS